MGVMFAMLQIEYSNAFQGSGCRSPHCVTPFMADSYGLPAPASDRKRHDTGPMPLSNSPLAVYPMTTTRSRRVLLVPVEPSRAAAGSTVCGTTKPRRGRHHCGGLPSAGLGDFFRLPSRAA